MDFYTLPVDWITSTNTTFAKGRVAVDGRLSCQQNLAMDVEAIRQVFDQVSHQSGMSCGNLRYSDEGWSGTLPYACLAGPKDLNLHLIAHGQSLPHR